MEILAQGFLVLKDVALFGAIIVFGAIIILTLVIGVFYLSITINWFSRPNCPQCQKWLPNITFSTLLNGRSYRCTRCHHEWRTIDSWPEMSSDHR